MTILSGVDPLNAVLWSVFLCAAGMYPLGFLFGACSDCCCPPCDKCNQYYAYTSIDGPCYDPVESITLAALVGDVEETVTVTGLLFEDEVNCQLPLFEWIQCDGDRVRPKIFRVALATDSIQDSCGCLACQLRFDFVVYADIENDDDIVPPDLAFSITVPVDRCQDNEPVVQYIYPKEQLEDYFNDNQFGGLNGCDYPEFKDVEIQLKIELDKTPCDCGACCFFENGVQCEKNVAKSYCEDSGTWYSRPNGVGISAGTGVSCDDIDCADYLGACIYNGTECTQTTEAICSEEFAGDWQGPGTICADFMGACCVPDFGCSFSSEAHCTEVRNGTWSGPNTTCDPDPCT